MYVSCSCLACDRRRYPTIREALRKIRDLGFFAFDLDAFEGWQHVDPSKLASGEAGRWAEEFLKAVDELGLKVSSFNCGLSAKLNDPDPEAFERCRREFSALLELAAEVGCPNITLQPGPFIPGYDQEHLLSVLRDHVLELARMCEGSGVGIGLEAHANTVIERPEAALRLMDEVYPEVGLTYDPSHFAMQGIPLEETEPLLRYAVHIHVRDAAPGRMQERVGEGVVDFRWLVEALRRYGYEGALTIEYFNDFDPDFSSVLALRDQLVKLGVSPKP